MGLEERAYLSSNVSVSNSYFVKTLQKTTCFKVRTINGSLLLVAVNIAEPL